MKKNILYIGNFVPPFSTENDYKKSFEALGWSVKPVQENKMDEKVVEEIIATAHNYDFILYTRTWARTDILWRKIMKGVKGRTPTVSVHLDLYFGLQRGDMLNEDGFFWSDYVFSADGGNQERFEKLGINHFFLPPAILKESCYLGEFNKEYDYDVVFVGNFNYHREWAYRPYLINWLKNAYGGRFKLFGSNGEVVRGKALNDLYATARVVVGDSTFSPNYWSDRVPETLGRGGFLIHPRVPEMEKCFTPYQHFIPYYVGEMETLKEIVDWYLAHPKERDAIRLAGQAHVRDNHTYENRAAEILEKLKEVGAIK